MDQKTLEINKTIGTFMGWDENGEYSSEIPMSYLSAEDMKYTSSWDWLMPVIDRIESIEDFVVDISYKQCEIISYERERNISSVRYLDTKIDAVISAVVDFINWRKELKE
ncbi:MAG: hypothetical protein ACYC5G_03995 [Candidatus Doudnabacteria bacterium]